MSVLVKAFIVVATLAILLTLLLVVGLAVRILDWFLTPSGRTRKVETMPPFEVVNQELQDTFGERECAWDADEEVTTPYSSEDPHVRYFPTEAHMDFHTYVHGDEFV
jgi:hypothetical protein